ncbi:MAG: hypothetical protein H6711_15170 [Myxococcales bacterium]|nr:hypothetical protein [Myxococcales bacterium]
MRTKITQRVLDLNALQERLDAPAYARLADEVVASVFPVFQAFFPDLSADDVRDKILRFNDRDLVRRRVFLFTAADAAGDRQVVGLAVSHVASLELDGRASLVLDGGGYFLPSHQRHGLTTQIGAREFRKLYLRNLLTRKRLFTLSPANPRSYNSFCGLIPVIYPSCRREMPEDIERLYALSKERLGYRTPEGRPYVLEDPAWRRREGSDGAQLEAGVTSADMDFYLRHCPDYLEGSALMVLIPWSWQNVSRGTVTALWKAVRRKLRRRSRPRAAQLPGS